MHLVPALLVQLAFSTQIVFCIFNSVSFSSIEQCGPFRVNFSGGQAPISPLSLTIVPFSANPLSIPIPLGSWDNASANGTAEVTFLPFNSGTQFVASLDNGNNESTGLVSDVIEVQSSKTSSCLPPKQKGTDFYDIKGDLNQCSHFNVTFNPSQIRSAPTIRAFLPRSITFTVNASGSPISTIPEGKLGTSKNGNGGDGTNKSHNNSNQHYNVSSKEYILDIPHGLQAVLLLNDGVGHQETSKLFTAGGDTSSSSGCFKESFNVGLPQPSQSVEASASTSKKILSRTAAIIIGVLCGTIFIILSGVTLFVLNRKRERIKGDLTTSLKSFVFTEDVDMGSSFVSRVRSRFSQFLVSNASLVTGEKRSYRSYRDEPNNERVYEDGASYGIPTLLEGGLVLHNSRPATEKMLSWTIFENETRDLNRNGLTDAVERQDLRDSVTQYTTPSQASVSPMLTPLATARVRTSHPDSLVLVASRYLSTSYFFFGSGYLPSHPSDAVSESRSDTVTTAFRPQIKLFSERMRRAKHRGRRSSSVIVPLSFTSSSGYMSSRSSNALTEPFSGEFHSNSSRHDPFSRLEDASRTAVPAPSNNADVSEHTRTVSGLCFSRGLVKRCRMGR
ncbi:hypothetical protein DFH11DRAFT_205508 [Phellopilus nigrolimitatus]|nr:hypothetical protein DFH11DRAFT_205508 [Phellopilus nigrolimitatus]